jgi:hypothetical protein
VLTSRLQDICVLQVTDRDAGEVAALGVVKPSGENLGSTKINEMLEEMLAAQIRHYLPTDHEAAAKAREIANSERLEGKKISIGLMAGGGSGVGFRLPAPRGAQRGSGTSPEPIDGIWLDARGYLSIER